MRSLRSGRLAAFPWLGAGLLIGFVLLLAGCGVDTPQNTFAPEGEVAEKQRDLLTLVLWPAIVVFILVEGLLVYALVRFRKRGEDGPLPKQVHGNTKLEIAWTILPTALMIGLAVPTIGGIIDLGRAPADDALQVRVIGFQWNWIVEYPEYTDADGNPLTVIGTCPTSCAEMHVPVEREVAVSLESSDVNHSFWIPRLAGKLDAIPGRIGRIWFNATSPGTYSGQCAEFCGIGHAGMRISVVAESQSEFEAWVRMQLGGEPASGASDRAPEFTETTVRSEE